MKLSRSRRRQAAGEAAPLEPFSQRFAQNPHALIAESRDWHQIDRSLASDEQRWARFVAREIPGVSPSCIRGDGMVFLTTAHVYFAFGHSAHHVPLQDVIRVWGIDVPVRLPRGWGCVAFLVRAPVNEPDLPNRFEIVVAVDDRDLPALYATVEAAKKSAATRAVAQQDAARADRVVWDTVPAVSVSHPYGPYGYNGVGQISITEHGEVVFSPKSSKHLEHVMSARSPDLWVRVDNDTSNWTIQAADQTRPGMVIADRPADARFYFQPPGQRYPFDAWAAKVREIGLSPPPRRGWSDLQ